MPLYTCPECEYKINKKNPLEPGKKLKCPECENIFAIPGEKAPPKPPPKPNPALVGDDDDGPAMYTVTAEEVNEEAEQIRKEAFDPLKERFEKSKRGPALTLVIQPSNLLLICGILGCIISLAGAFVFVFPLIFKVQDVTKTNTLYTPEGSQKTKYIDISDEKKMKCYWGIAASVVFFAWCSVVVGGASKMHELETYWLAMTGSIMGILGPLVPVGVWLYMEGGSDTGELDMAYIGPAIICFASGLPASIWCVKTLRSEKVLIGFAEEPPE